MRYKLFMYSEINCVNLLVSLSICLFFKYLSSFLIYWHRRSRILRFLLRKITTRS